MYKGYWKVNTFTSAGFKGVLFFYGKEEDLVPYLKTEDVYWISYSGATDNEVASAKTLGLPVYKIR